MNYDLNNNKNIEKIINKNTNPQQNRNEDIFRDKNEYYYRFLKLPKPSERKYEEIRKMRGRQLMHNSRIDTSPRVFFALPFYSQHLRAQYREPDEINIEDIKNRKKFDPVDHTIRKEKKLFEEKLNKNYTKDEEHSRIKDEINRTYRELYGEDFKP